VEDPALRWQDRLQLQGVAAPVRGLVEGDRGDNQWHTVRCTRTSVGVTIVVDGGTPKTNGVWTGNIANTWPLAIGGKPKCDGTTVGCDYFVGRLDRAVVEKASP
jgi:hypothetical protein